MDWRRRQVHLGVRRDLDLERVAAAYVGALRSTAEGVVDQPGVAVASRHAATSVGVTARAFDAVQRIDPASSRVGGSCGDPVWATSSDVRP